MCGLAGFVGRKCDWVVMNYLMKRAAGRGPHGWAVETLSGHKHSAQRSRLSSLEKFSEYPFKGDEKIVLAHFRASTDGLYDESRLQPLKSGNLHVSHNGVASQYKADEIESDTMKMLADISRFTSGLDKFAIFAQRALEHDNYALAATDWESVVLMRSKLPLHIIEYKDGVYWCSCMFLQSQLIEENTILHTEKI